MEDKRLKNSTWDLLFAVVVFSLITLLIIDRVVHVQVIRPIHTIGEYMAKAGEKRMWDQLVPATHPHRQFVPVWNRCGQPGVAEISFQLAEALAMNQHNASVETAFSSVEDLLRKLQAGFRPIAKVLSDTFVTLQRFIQTRRNFLAVENALNVVTTKFDKQEFVLDPTLKTRLDAAVEMISHYSCTFHQSTPALQGWAFQLPQASNNDSLFPVRQDWPLHQDQVSEYLKAAHDRSPFPLWYQNSKPSTEIYDQYLVFEEPTFDQVPWMKTFEQWTAELELQVIPHGQPIKTVAWQLRNLTALVDRAAKYTSPEANAVFIQLVTKLNERLSQIDPEEKERWDALAWDIASHDIHTVDALTELKEHFFFKHRPRDAAELRSRVKRELAPWFRGATYWIFPKGLMAPEQRLQAMSTAAARDPQVLLSPEAPVLFWWVEGRFLEQAKITFKWRQLIVGSLIGICLGAWTIKRLYLS